MTQFSAGVASLLQFGGSSSRINIHRDGIAWGWSRVGETRREAICLGELSDGGSGSQDCGFRLGSPEVSGSESSVSRLVLVEPNGGFEPCLRVQVIRPTGSHGCYCVRDRGVKASSEFDHYGLWVGIAGIGY
jgi:hypothetical protein